MHRLSFSVIVITIAVSTPATPGWAQQHAEHYVLDAFGGVHAGGGAPLISPATPYFGFDVAADLEFVAVATATVNGNGLLVLDKFGGVHRGGALVTHPPGGAATPYFGFDAARALTLRDVPPRAAGVFNGGGVAITSPTYTVMSSVTIRAPDDGFLIATATSSMHCGVSGGVSVFYALALNGNVPLSGTALNYRIPECGNGADVRPAAQTYVFPVAAGTHTVNLVALRSSGTATVFFNERSISVIYVDRNLNGSS